MSRRAIAIVAGCVALVLAVVAALPFTPAMPVDDVNVEGAVNLPAEEIEGLSGVEVGTPMGRVDVRGLLLVLVIARAPLQERKSELLIIVLVLLIIILFLLLFLILFLIIMYSSLHSSKYSSKCLPKRILKTLPHSADLQKVLIRILIVLLPLVLLILNTCAPPYPHQDALLFAHQNKESILMSKTIYKKNKNSHSKQP